MWANRVEASLFFLNGCHYIKLIMAILASEFIGWHFYILLTTGISCKRGEIRANHLTYLRIDFPQNPNSFLLSLRVFNDNRIFLHFTLHLPKMIQIIR